MEELDIQNLEEIISLYEKEINNNNENISAVLDLEDLKALSSLLNRYKLYRKQLNDVFDRGFIHKNEIKEKIEKNKQILDKTNDGNLRERLYIENGILKELLGEE